MAVEAPRSQGRGGFWAEGLACYVKVQNLSLTLAAEALGISRSTLWRKMKRLGIDDPGWS